MLQNNIFAAINWIDITPNLLLIATFAIGFMRGKVDGMIVGFFCGLLSDLFFSTNIGVYALIYLVIGYFCGLLGELFYTDFILIPVLFCLLSDLVYSVYVYCAYFLLKGATNFGFYLVNVILPEMIYTMIMMLICYGPLRRLNGWIEKLETKTARKYV